jgi:hypothetical protein
MCPIDSVGHVSTPGHVTSHTAIDAASAWLDRHEAETGESLHRPLSHIKSFLDGVRWARTALEANAFILHQEDGTEERVVSLKAIDQIFTQGDYGNTNTTDTDPAE